MFLIVRNSSCSVSDDDATVGSYLFVYRSKPGVYTLTGKLPLTSGELYYFELEELCSEVTKRRLIGSPAFLHFIISVITSESLASAVNIGHRMLSLPGSFTLPGVEEMLRLAYPKVYGAVASKADLRKGKRGIELRIQVSYKLNTDRSAYTEDEQSRQEAVSSA